jgi:hypothetical protein
MPFPRTEQIALAVRACAALGGPIEDWSGNWEEVLPFRAVFGMRCCRFMRSRGLHGNGLVDEIRRMSPPRVADSRRFGVVTTGTKRQILSTSFLRTTGTLAMISRTDVIDAFRAVLGREPESEQVTEHHLSVSSVAELYRILLESEEFRVSFGAREASLPIIPLPMHHSPSPVKASRLTTFFEEQEFETKNFDHDGDLIKTLLFFDATQREAGIVGCIGEIGVAAGAFFVPLALCCQEDELAVAIDVFDQVALNWDPSGGISSTSNLKKIIEHVIGNDDQIRYINGDSFFLRSQTIRSVTDGKGFRLFSIDGAHSAHHTVNDLRIVGEIINDGGIVFLDDFANWGWPGVVTGFARYMLLNDHQRLVPFFLYGNKVVLTTPSHQEYFLRKTGELQRLYGRLPDVDYRIADFFGYRVLGWP